MLVLKTLTRDAFSLKVLAELLQNNIKTACFEVKQSGITLRMMDHPNNRILIDINMEADNFSVFKFKSDEPLTLGINLSHFHKMLKTVKKRDSLQLFIDDESPTDLGIKIIPKENNRVTTSCIKIQNLQNIDVDLPEGYGKPVIVPSGEFQKMCKGLTHISNVTRITSKGFLIRFSSDADGVMKRYTEFGETEESDSETEDSGDEDSEYCEDFDTEQLTKITKLAGLSSTMQIYPKKGIPLLFRTQIGTLGRISVYVKSKSQQEMESHAVEDDE